MSLHAAVSAERPHIAFFGRRNAGKSSVVNAVTNQQMSLVSDTLGTTTDPVRKAMELLPLGPVMIIDTPGFDDEGALGALRVERTREILRRTDIAVLVVDATRGIGETERELIDEFRSRGLRYVLAFNKSDLLSTVPVTGDNEVYVSALTGDGIDVLKSRIASFVDTRSDRRILEGLVSAGDTVVLVIPIDAAAPKGRLILPQQMTLRELLDTRCTAVCCQPGELRDTLQNLHQPPALVVTDSQAFASVSAGTPDELPLTSFSILFARYKGELPALMMGVDALRALSDGDRVLIAEGCTHHRQCGDIGTEKLPRWIRDYTGVKPDFSFSSGNSFPSDLGGYRMVVHCGGCMLNEREMQSRAAMCAAAGVPMLNYGVAIAEMHGVLDRALRGVRVR